MQDRKAKLFVFAAPSGAGKTTLVHAVVTKRPELRFSISYTTRKPRRNEADGVDYLFVTEDEFMRLRDQGEMLEYAKVFDNYYATSRSQVEKHLADNRNVILEIDWQGAQQVRQSMPECVTIFILPPSVEELERRLRDRRTDSAEVIERRLSDALSDMSHWTEFDHVIINDDLNRAIADLEDVLDGEGEASATSNIALRRAVERIIG
ncbi:MAG: guanylate kinase [Gammaproteobacteria bacterium]|nr:guanylate kinase [Gammaproteobacteria bacterium]MDH3820636.1 guanylate kinase [Gammaproteobacteria bacterium]MDH3907238.1 guanylate kinase [Gammaproteobacteria bacterium]MDH3908213.1 guanylate kinase [Gammaproteobacteria bacterium]MDH3983968.1 guanylate kinase [Gammaproteobacteria bacterium]